MGFRCLDLFIRTLLVPLPRARTHQGLCLLWREGRAALAAKGATSTWASDAGEAGEKGGGQREDLKEKCSDQMFSVFSTHYCGSIAE